MLELVNILDKQGLELVRLLEELAQVSLELPLVRLLEELAQVSLEQPLVRLLEELAQVWLELGPVEHKTVPDHLDQMVGFHSWKILIQGCPCL